MGILPQSFDENMNSDSILNKVKKIPDYARDYKNEYLFIRGINKVCGDFVKRLDEEENPFNNPQANKLIFYFNKFLKAQEIEYLKDISDFCFKEKDVKFIESLELRLVYIKTIYGDLNIIMS